MSQLVGTVGGMTTPMTLSPLRFLDPDEVGEAARRESRNREIHLPPVSVYRWWARRTLAVNAAVLEAAALQHDRKLLVADPFAGGGVIPLAVADAGHRLYAQDLNPWAATGLHAMLSLPSETELREAFGTIRALMRSEVQHAYGTMLSDGSAGLVSHTFRVATSECPECAAKLTLFPHALVSLVKRRERGKPEAWLACPCGRLHLGKETKASKCPCGRSVDPKASYTRRRAVNCHSCGQESRLEDLASGGFGWDVVLVERASASSRELDLPTRRECRLADEAAWMPRRKLGPIPEGAETKVLTRHGFSDWEDLYPARQRVLLESLLDHIESLSSPAQEALRLAALGTAEMAGHASRWDRYYLKSYETMANHRFNFTTLAVEPNVWGAEAAGRGTMTRRFELFAKACRWFEKRPRLSVAPLQHVGDPAVTSAWDAIVTLGSSEHQNVPDGVVDLVLTDPPYHDDVQYGELSHPLRAWAGLSLKDLAGEAVANPATGANSGYDDYEELLARIFAESRRTLAGDGHLIFSYANREPEAWVALLGALDTAGLAGCGYALVHSENETDAAKRGVRACTMDLVLDLVPAAENPRLRRWRPKRIPTSPEGKFLQIVGEAVLSVGGQKDDWRTDLISALRRSAFLA